MVNTSQKIGVTVSFGFRWTGTHAHVMWFGDTTDDFPQGIEAFISHDVEISKYFLNFNIFTSDQNSSLALVDEALVQDNDYHFTAVFTMEPFDYNGNLVTGRWRIYRDGLLVDSTMDVTGSTFDIDFLAPGTFSIGESPLDQSIYNTSPIYDLKMYYCPLSRNEVWNAYFYDYIKENKQVPLAILANLDTPNRIAQGGARAGSQAIITTDYNIVSDSGAVIAGHAYEFVISNGVTVYNEIASGGARSGGSAVVRKVCTLAVTGGGVLAGSAAVRKIDSFITTGGAVLAGVNVTPLMISSIVALGGAEIGGSLTTVFSEVTSGGVRGGGSIVLKRGTVRSKRQNECFGAKVCKLRIKQIGSLGRRVYIEDQCRRPFRLWAGYVPGAASCPGEAQFARIIKVQTAVLYKNQKERGKLPNSNFGDVR
jgi:hypothetical protein